MRIDEISLFHVEHPLIEPWTTAYGSDASIHSVLVRMRSGAHTGWAESCPLREPTYSPESAAGVFLVEREFFAPALIGREFASARALLDRLSVFKGNPFAKAGLEMAWWTLQSEMEQRPLHRLLGGRPGAVRVGADFGLGCDLDVLLQRIQGAIDRGFPRVKLKVKPGRDIEILRAVRRAFPRFTFHIDCNSGYTLKDLPLFRQIDELGLAMIEQPLGHADLVDHARLQKELSTPVCLDESCNSVEAARTAVEIGACRYMNIKPPRVGGLQNALDIHDLCRAAGIPCWVGGMLESSVGAGICLALATLDNFVYPNDIAASDRYFPEEISARKLELSAPGTMRVDDTPTYPFVPLEDRLRQRTISSADIRA